MSNKIKATIYILIMVIALGATAVLYMMMPVCENCGRKFCFGSCTIRYELDGTTNTVSAEEWVRPRPETNQTTTRLAETDPVDPEEYFDNVCLIGDSRTNALQLYGVPLDCIFAQDGLNQEQALDTAFIRINDSKPVTIAEAVMYAAPEVMIVNFGINGIAWWTNEGFMESYEALIEELEEASPDSIIVIEAILPISISYEQRTDTNGLTNERIDEVNELLYEYAQKNGYYYMATNEIMKNEYNDLKREYSADGIHFTQTGYEAIIDYILTHAIYRE